MTIFIENLDDTTRVIKPSPEFFDGNVSLLVIGLTNSDPKNKIKNYKSYYYVN